MDVLDGLPNCIFCPSEIFYRRFFTFLDDPPGSECTPQYDVVGTVVTLLADTVRQTKGHATVIGPITGRLAMNAAAHHFCDGVLLQIRPCPALRRYAQGVRYAQAVYSISDG